MVRRCTATRPIFFSPASTVRQTRHPLSLSEIHPRIYRWCSPPKIGTGSTRRIVATLTQTRYERSPQSAGLE